MAITYSRLLYTVVTNPGYVERSAQWYARKAEEKKSKRSRRGRNKISYDTHEKNHVPNGNIGDHVYSGPNAVPDTLANEQRPGLQDFFSRDVFICQGDGRPIWCSHCQNWKPDRAHHCREVGHCVRKMDHFCPWVGGIVSETSFKYFTQFVGWGAVYCIFNLILMAILVAEHSRRTGTVNVHWVVTLAFGVLFGLFATGMTGSSLHFALVNTTTIENLSRKNAVYQLAIHMPRPPQTRPPFPTISFSTAQKTDNSEPSPDTIKTFAILHTRPGENPWDLGALGNLKEVMGEHWYDWFLPIKHSPCSNHDRSDSQFAMGPVVDRLKREAGLLPPFQEEKEKPHRQRRHRRRKRPREEKRGAEDKEVNGEEEEEEEEEQEEDKRRHTGHDRHEEQIVNGSLTR